MENLSGKFGEWALVVGASTGLGACWAEECAKRGFNVIICARRLEKLQEVSAGIRKKYGVSTKEFTVDISEENASNTIIENIRGLDIGILIYNAAIEHVGYFIKVDEAYHEKQVVGNAIVPMRLCWYLCRDMARKHRGCILLCSSMAAAVGCGANAVYGAVKTFELTLAEGLWYEMRKYGVTAAGVMVGAIATPEFMRVKESLMKENASDKKAAQKAKKNKGQLPFEVAKYVLDHVGDGPVLFTSPGDRRMYHLMVKLPRKQSCIMMGSVMDKEFNSGYEQLDDHFTEIQ